MDELTSTEFRKRYGKLTEPALVTVNGHVIGQWVPVAGLIEFLNRPNKGSVQERRDDLLRKINRGR